MLHPSAWLRIRLVLLAVCALASAAWAAPEDYREGDLIYIKIPTAFGRAIEDVTHSPVSHVGIVARHASGRLTVVHALGNVQEEPLERFLERSKGHWAVQRYAFRSPEDVGRFVQAARALLGLPYDHHFVVDNDEIYCSELVYRAFKDGLHLIPVALRPLSFGAPGTQSRMIMERVTQGPIPDGTPGVAPGDYFSHPAFALVEDHLAGFAADASAH